MTDELSFIVLKRVEGEYPPEEREQVAELLKRYKGDSEQRRKRVHLGILKLAKGNKEELAHLVGVALTDYRDILYWAEYCQGRRTSRTQRRRGGPAIDAGL